MFISLKSKKKSKNKGRQKCRSCVGSPATFPSLLKYMKIVDTLKVTKISTIREKNILNGWRWYSNIHFHGFMEILYKNCLIQIKNYWFFKRIRVLPWNKVRDWFTKHVDLHFFDGFSQRLILHFLNRTPGSQFQDTNFRLPIPSFKLHNSRTGLGILTQTEQMPRFQEIYKLTIPVPGSKIKDSGFKVQDSSF